MSKLEVKVTGVFNLLKHPNADKLEIAEVGGKGGYVSVVGKDQFKPGDFMIYVPVDAVLPDTVSKKLQENSKITIGPRIRTARIRGVLSQGLCLKAAEWLSPDQILESTDVSEILGIKKYQPPEPEFKGFAGRGISISYQNENFDKYTDVEHFAKFPSSIKEGTPVVATVKYHGTNFRAGLVRKPFYKDSPFLRLVKKIGYFFGITASQHEFLVGSHNTIRKVSKTLGVLGVDDLYWKIALKYNVQKVCEQEMTTNIEIDNIIIYGEIVGPGIQKGYSYGIEPGDHQLVIFDIKVNGRYLSWPKVVELATKYGLIYTTVAFSGPFDAKVLDLAEAIDVYSGQEHIREGLVIRPIEESYDVCLGRVILKRVSAAYLMDSSNSDFH